MEEQGLASLIMAFRQGKERGHWVFRARRSSADSVANLRRLPRPTLEQIHRGDNAAHQHDRADAHPEAEPLFQDLARLRAVAVEQEGEQIKAHPARNK